MQKVKFSTNINAAVKKVWDTLIEDKTYRQWTKPFHEGSYFIGTWEKGSEIRFMAPDETGNLGGMFSRIKENDKYKFISIEHLGFIKDGVVDTSSEAVKKWAGAHENYTFTEKDGKTEVKVEMELSDEYATMFDDMWPKALSELKRLSEQS